jgi:LuxR family transcriptional regulator, maltose regulon positive regulatory protein
MKAAERIDSTVFSYKFIAPVPYAGAITRSAILQRIADFPGARVVLLQGPAGHGKSTVLQQLKDVAQAAGQLTGWLTLDSGDNDPRRFLLHIQSLVASLTHIPGQSQVRVLEPREVSAHFRPDWLVDRIARIGRPVALFFDELQSLTDKTVLGFLAALFERAPDSLRIFVGTRSLPDVGLARLVVNNRALILKGDDLRFSAQEVTHFFAAAGELGIDLDEIDIIYRRTEGWPAALQLFRLTLGSPLVRKTLGSESARAPRELAEYLAENVLALQPPRVQEFLLRTSLLARLSAPLCDEVLGCSDSREMLLHLERSGMFLRCIDPQSGWFKYHNLFSSILAEQLRLHRPDAAQDVHRRASHWYKENGVYEDSVQHAVVCHEFPTAAEALNLWSSRLVADGQLRTVEHWYERVSFQEVIARPQLAIKCAYALVFLRRRQRARPLLDFLSRYSGRADILETTDPNVVLAMAAIAADDIPTAYSISGRVPLNQRDAEGFSAFELAAAANLRGYCALAAQEFEAAREYLALARVYNEHVDATFSRSYTIAVTAVALLIQGELQEAIQRIKAGLAERRLAVEKSSASAALFCVYIWALYEADEPESAEAVFLQNKEAISETARTDFIAVAYLSMARIHDSRAHHSKADAVLSEAESIGHQSGWPRLVSTIKWERARRLLVRGLAPQAESIATSARIESTLAREWIPFANDAEDAEFGEIRLALAQGHFSTAQWRIQAALKRQRGRVLRKIKLHLLSAVHGARTGDNSACRRELRTGLRLAQMGGFVRCVLDEGDPVLRLIKSEYRALLDSRGATAIGQELEFMQCLLERSGTGLAQLPERSPTSLQALTDRERELLVLLANGTSNKDVANRMFVSENTVKFHLKNIYAKLAVSSRVRAITAAREIGLIQ